MRPWEHPNHVAVLRRGEGVVKRPEAGLSSCGFLLCLFRRLCRESDGEGVSVFIAAAAAAAAADPASRRFIVIVVVAFSL